MEQEQESRARERHSLSQFNKGGGGLTQFVMLSLALIGIINVMPVCNKHSLLSGPNTWGIFLILHTALALNKLTERLAIYIYTYIYNTSVGCVYLQYYIIISKTRRS